jgi:hypothetical protein
MKYPSEINFKKEKDGICVCYKDNSEVKYSLDIWAISYLLNEKLYQDRKENIVHLPVTDRTMALRIFFLQHLFKNIVFDVANAGDFKEIEDIVHDNGKKYITYSTGFPPRGKRKTKEALIEQYLSEDLSRLSETEFAGSNKPMTQFPANIFEEQISKKNRVTRKFWIDILSVNNFNQLSVIELKTGANCPLDILMQAIDYGIYCHLFKEHIADSFFGGVPLLGKNKIAIYCVVERFHPGLVGRDDIKGILPLLQQNDLFDLILFEIRTTSGKIEGKPVIVYDSRSR